MAVNKMAFVDVGLWAIVAVMLLGGGLFGCKGYSQDDNTFTITWGTSLVFESVGPKDATKRGEFGMDFQDWIKRPFTKWVFDSDGDGVPDMSGLPDEATTNDGGGVDGG